MSIRAIGLLGVSSLFVMTTACDHEAPARATTRDSAGVVIVENTTPAWREGESWTADPTLDLGSSDGGPEQEFDQIRGLLRLSDGRIVVADGKSLELRVFSGSGQFLDRWGRKGGGPGEFEEIEWILPYPAILFWLLMPKTDAFRSLAVTEPSAVHLPPGLQRMATTGGAGARATGVSSSRPL